MKILLPLFALLLAPSAFANTYVICGKSVDADTMEATGYELELSSEGEDDYSGPVGKKWNMKLDSQDSEWLAPSEKVIAKNYEQDGDTIIEIKIIQGQSPSGPVGTRYKLIGLYNDEPVLEKFTMGGFAGTIKVGTFQCASGND